MQARLVSYKDSKLANIYNNELKDCFVNKIFKENLNIIIQ